MSASSSSRFDASDTDQLCALVHTTLQLHYIDAQYDPTKIKRVVIQIHGDNRDAWNQWLYADLAANRAAQGGTVKREEILVMAPQFFITDDYGAYPFTLAPVPTPSSSSSSSASSTATSTRSRSSDRNRLAEEESTSSARSRNTRSSESSSTSPAKRALGPISTACTSHRLQVRASRHHSSVDAIEKRADAASDGIPESSSEVLIWANSGWGQGDAAVEPPGVGETGTFDALDAAVGYFLDRNRFPVLTKVVVAGFSLGGQLTQRYAAFRPADEDESRVNYWVSSPNSFVYFNDTRPLRPGRTCRDNYNDYKYGLGGTLPDYVTNATNPVTDPAAILSRYLSRTIIYLCGERDKTAGVSDCPSDCQGSHHVSKMAYWTERVLPYLPGSTMDGTLPATSSVHWIGKTSHQDWKIINSDPGVYSLFLQGYNDDGTDAAAPPSNGVVGVKSPRAESSPAGRTLPSGQLSLSALVVATSIAVVLLSSCA